MLDGTSRASSDRREMLLELVLGRESPGHGVAAG